VPQVRKIEEAGASSEREVTAPPAIETVARTVTAQLEVEDEDRTVTAQVEDEDAPRLRDARARRSAQASLPTLAEETERALG
jgi:hypothetical protein